MTPPSSCWQAQDKRAKRPFEAFVFSELTKHASNAEDAYQLMHYRDADKVEVDLVIENSRGDIVGIEVKAAATVKATDFKGLRKLSSLAGPQFKMGVLLYDGDATMPVGDKLWAAPISTLWGELPTSRP